jgi:hypothetical protein
MCVFLFLLLDGIGIKMSKLSTNISSFFSPADHSAASSFLSALQPADAAVAALATLVQQLNETSQVLLRQLIEFLTKVAAHSDRNKMTAHNLAIVIEPNILRKKSIMPNDMDALLKQGTSGAVELMINHCAKIFR